MGLSSAEVTLKRPLRWTTAPSAASSTAIAIRMQQDLKRLPTLNMSASHR